MTDIPKLGLGTFGRTGEDGLAAILKALEIGYRHIDTAQSYGTEANVGEAVRRSGVPRADIFVTTKVADTNLDRGAFMDSVARSVDTIGLGPVDLLLIHWPRKESEVPFQSYMEDLAEAKSRGLARRIGVSNFTAALLEQAETLLGRDALATNQVELHPLLQAPRLVRAARALGVPLTAYLPIARGAVNDEPVMRRIAQAHGVTPPAISLAFLMAEGHIVIPASSREDNLRANWAARGVRLGEDEIREIRALDRGQRFINPAKAPPWDD